MFPKAMLIGLLGSSLADRASALDDSALAKRIESFVSEEAAADRFSGAVMVSHDDRIVFQGAWGLASRSFQAPNQVDTRFNLGSMNKMFTAVAVSQLAQQGKLSFEDKVGKHLPDWPNPEVRDRVTIHQLLTHTSGMGSYFNDEYQRAAKQQFRKVKDYRPLYVAEPLQFEPGSRWAYSNSGFMVLGEIVEAVSGRNYFDYVREHVTGPLGMASTDCYEMDRDTPNLAIGYTSEGPHSLPEGERWNNLFLHVVKGGPAGGGFSTVGDLLKFASALRGGKLLSPEYTARMTEGKVTPDPEHPESRYGYGIGERKYGTERVVGHSGGFPGINGGLEIYWKSGHALAVLSNYDPPAAENILRHIRSLILPE